MATATKKTAPPPTKSKEDKPTPITFQINQAELLAAITEAGRFLPSRPAAPITGAVWLEAGGDTMTVSTFDLETGFVKTVPTSPGTFSVGQAVALPGKQLVTVLRKMLDKRGTDPVSVSMVGKDGPGDDFVQFQVGQAQFKLAVLNPDGMVPPHKQDRPGARLLARLQPGDLQALAEVAVAAGSDDTLPALTGVSVEFDKTSGVTSAATDRYRLAFATQDRARVSEEVKVLIPARTLKLAARTISRDAEVQIWTDKDTSRVWLEATPEWFQGIQIRLLDGEFPKWRSLIPSNTSRAVIDLPQLGEAVTAAWQVAERNQPLRLSLSANGAKVEVGNGNEAVWSMNIGADPSPDLVIGLNPAYLMDGLGLANGSTVEIEFTTSTKPILIHGTPGPLSSLGYLQMPVRMGD